MTYRDILRSLVLLISFGFLISLTLSGDPVIEDEINLTEEEYPRQLDTLEEFIQSYYLLLDSKEYLNKYKLVDHEKNVIQNDANNLDPFYQKLLELRNGVRTRVSIFQIGDSHIQSGYFAGTARSSLQKYYGNAGRGLVFPWRLAGTNQPDDIRITSTSPWNRTNVERGICGYGIWSRGTGNLHIRTNNFFGLDNSYNKVTLITKEKENSYNWTLSGFDEFPNTEIQSFDEQAIYQLQWNTPVRELALQFNATEANDVANLYGVILEKTVPGLLYHSVGVNGATFDKLSRIEDFFAQIRLLNPDLIVISLGTNDAQGRYRNDYFEKQLRTFAASVKRYSPNTPILFTLPPDSNKGGKHNADLEKMDKEIIDFAKKNHAAWWDLSDLMGGKGSIRQWRSASLASSDLLHFTPKGYMLQGHLFYQALIKGYMNYAESKR
ncbi:MAG: hypothetical protein CVU48_10460 [Candidatus Cloacimonetes bacterium HGW-Cloacimonetes-1]|jgi:lysophospholipase L1-like esterase|nr:MAG: hypothetical protein CVU48_10460 [Candidatus Cloacimonetes bacterium HGW-Cloacimonetes-1]